jgi:quercetin dioxygenase-like cupin family protein
VHAHQQTEQWGADGFFFTEAARGGPLTWRRGAAALEGDALGPVRHVHDDAAEYFYMHRGSLRIEACGEEFVLVEGQLCLIPPDAPHNVLGLASEDVDAELYCLIGPNFATSKWRIDDFKPGSESLGYEVGTPFADDTLPGAGTLSAEGLSLAAGEAPLHVEPDGRETVYLVVDGELEIALFGGLHGTIQAGTYVHVREGVAHELSTQSSCKVLRMNCAFALWEGVEVPDDGAASEPS